MVKMGNFPKPRWIATGSTGYFWMTTEFCARQEQQRSWTATASCGYESSRRVHVYIFNTSLCMAGCCSISCDRGNVSICSKICLPFETEIPTVLWIRNKHFENIRRCNSRSFSLSETFPRRDSSNDDHVVGLLCFDCHGAVSWRIGHATNGAIYIASFLSVISAWWNIWKAVSQTL